MIGPRRRYMLAPGRMGAARMPMYFGHPFIGVVPACSAEDGPYICLQIPQKVLWNQRNPNDGPIPISNIILPEEANQQVFLFCHKQISQRVPKSHKSAILLEVALHKMGALTLNPILEKSP